VGKLRRRFQRDLELVVVLGLPAPPFGELRCVLYMDAANPDEKTATTKAKIGGGGGDRA
tara:strand:- start:253 stop:429 length:177 start_codon:yes stop_codon:yes gene_type:complete